MRFTYNTNRWKGIFFVCEKERIVEKQLFEVDKIILRNERLFIFILLYMCVRVCAQGYGKVFVRKLGKTKLIKLGPIVL